jgi:transcriptional regulator with XRE-family HTH domain
MDYGKAIRVVRTAYGLTQADLAQRLSVGASQLSLIEAGKRQPSLQVLDDVSVALGVPPHLLTLLASEPSDIDDPKNAAEVAELAKSLLRLLVSAGHQPTLPMHSKKRKSA